MRRDGSGKLEAFPEALPSLAFIVEPVNAVDGRTLVVASKQEEILRVFYLVRKQ